MYKSGADACFAIRLIAYFPEDTEDTLTISFYSLFLDEQSKEGDV